MTIDRAMEVVDSLGVIDVTYRNHSVWIESVDKIMSEATVKDLDDGEIMQVSIQDLKESE